VRRSKVPQSTSESAAILKTSGHFARRPLSKRFAFLARDGMVCSQLTTRFFMLPMWSGIDTSWRFAAIKRFECLAVVCCGVEKQELLVRGRPSPFARAQGHSHGY